MGLQREARLRRRSRSRGIVGSAVALLTMLFACVGCGVDAVANAIVGGGLEKAVGDGGFSIGNLSECTTGALCFQLLPFDAPDASTPPPTGYVVVVWEATAAAPNADPASVIAYAAQFQLAELVFGIPVQAIADPPPALAACMRPCSDTTNPSCACNAGSQVGIGWVAIVRSLTDPAGALGDVRNIIGLAQGMQVIYSATTLPPIAGGSLGDFPNGLQQGIAGYTQTLLSLDGGAVQSYSATAPNYWFAMAIAP